MPRDCGKTDKNNNMSQLYLTGSYASWDSQSADVAFMDSNYYIMLAGNAVQGSVTSAVAIQFTGGINGWQNIYPGEFTTFFSGMTQLGDGTYMAVGTYSTSPNAGNENIWIVNIAQGGHKIWETQVGAKGIQSSGTAIAATADGGFVITGFQVQDGQPSTLVQRYAADKTVLWQKSQSGIVCFSIAANADGTFILSGRNTAGGFNNSPVALLLDGEGNVLMNTAFTSFRLYVVQATDAIRVADGNFVMVAKSVILKFSPAGGIIWSWNTPNGNFSSVRELPNGNLTVGGSIIINNTSQAYVAETDGGGNNIIWDNSQVMGPSNYRRVFVDPREGGVVWAGGYAPLNANNSAIVFASFDPVKTLMG
jgi:hypothetical protein